MTKVFKNQRRFFQAFICLILLSAAALVAASTKGWLFGLSKNNGEQIAMSRIQVMLKVKENYWK